MAPSDRADPARRDAIGSAAECPLAEDGSCPFPPEHLSGALDGVLTRVDLARVRQRLLACPHCAAVFEEMQLNRDAARTTVFPVPPDDQWNEAPRSLSSHLARNVGLSLFAALALAISGLFLVQPRLLEQEIVVSWLIRGVIVATLAVLVSAGIDRWRTAKGDLYRGVKR